jgi:proteasome beta subunit
VEFGAAGSGSERIRGVFDYILKTKGPFHEMTLKDALRESLLLLDIAADLDSATAGIEKVLPVARAVTSEGIMDIPEEMLSDIRASLRR